MNQVYLKDQFLMIRDGDGKTMKRWSAPCVNTTKNGTWKMWTASQE